MFASFLFLLFCFLLGAVSCLLAFWSAILAQSVFFYCCWLFVFRVEVFKFEFCFAVCLGLPPCGEWFACWLGFGKHKLLLQQNNNHQRLPRAFLVWFIGSSTCNYGENVLVSIRLHPPGVLLARAVPGARYFFAFYYLPLSMCECVYAIKRRLFHHKKIKKT